MGTLPSRKMLKQQILLVLVRKKKKKTENTIPSIQKVLKLKMQKKWPCTGFMLNLNVILWCLSRMCKNSIFRIPGASITGLRETWIKKIKNPARCQLPSQLNLKSSRMAQENLSSQSRSNITPALGTKDLCSLQRVD